MNTERREIILIEPAASASPIAAEVRDILAIGEFDLTLFENDQQFAARSINGAIVSEPAAVLIGPGVAHPASAARRVHAATPSLFIVFLTTDERAARLRHELMFTPLIGTQWAVAVAGDLATLPRAIDDAAAAARQRRQFRTTLDRMNVRLSSRPPVDSSEYRKLVASDRYLANLLRHAPDAIFSLDLAGIILSWNDGAQRLTGVANSDATGKHLSQVAVWPEELGSVVTRALAGEAVLGHEMRLTFGAKTVDGEFTLTPVRDADGRQIGVAAMVRDVTERRAAEEARRMTEFRWQRLVEQSPQSMQIFAPDGVMRQVNGAWERLWGIKMTDLPGYNILRDEQLVKSGMMPLFDRAFAGESVTIEPILYTLDIGVHAGKPRWVGAYIYPVKDEAGRIEEVVLVHNDVTEQRLAQDALRNSERRLRSLIEQSAAGIAQTDLTGRILFANDRYCQILGYPIAELLQLRVHDLTHADDLAETAKIVATGASTGKEYAMEKRYVRKDGSIVWVDVSASIIKNEAGEPQAIMGVVIDISDRKQIEAALTDSETKFRQLAETIPQLAWMARPEGDIFWYNRRWYEYTGTTAQEMEGWGWQRVHDPAMLPSVVERWKASIATGSPFEMEFPLRSAGGTFRTFLTRVEPLRDSTGRVVQWFGTNTDVTDQRRAAEEREHLLASERTARAEAERASRMKDEFLATLSHELRTPLNAILGWSQIIQKEEKLSEDVAQGLEIIERNARAQAQIIEDLLDMSRIISGKVRLEVQPLDLAGIVQASVETAKPTTDAKGVRLQTIIDPLEDFAINGDANRLQQVLWNLLANAIKFTPRNGSIRVLLRRAASHVEICVSDTGEGIKPEFLPYVFDRFRQADASITRRHGGLGLGLSIVRQLVELHGGSVSVQSKGLGQGATFIVSLPLAIASHESEPEPQHPPSIPASRPVPTPGPCTEIRGVRALVVDDEPDARALVRRLLEDCEAVVTMAGSAEEAVRLLKENPFDVLVSDIGMPDEDGYALIRRVRALDPVGGGDIPAIALTAYAREEDRAKALAAGFQTHVAKPLEPAELIHTIAALAATRPA
ncbi:MAG TPA: PAS domain S-box protein [Tepidisphaeraceae bacterium]